MRLRFGRWEMRVIWRKRPGPYCTRLGHLCATPGKGPCNGLPRPQSIASTFANPALIGTERKAADEFRCGYARDCTMPWTPHFTTACAPVPSHDDCPPEGCDDDWHHADCPVVMPAEIREALAEDPPTPGERCDGCA